MNADPIIYAELYAKRNRICNPVSIIFDVFDLSLSCIEGGYSKGVWLLITGSPMGELFIRLWTSVAVLAV